MPITANDYENLIKDPLSMGLFRGLRRMNDILKLFPIFEAQGLAVTGQKWSTLPTTNFRAINEDFTPSTGKTEPVEDRLAIIGGSFQADKVFDKMREPVYRKPVDQQFDMQNKALNRDVSYYLFNGSVDTDPKQFNGFFHRFDSGDFPSDQVIDLATSGDSLKVLASETNARAFFTGLDAAIYEAGLYGVPEAGTAKGAIFLNKKSYLAFQEAARIANYSTPSRDVLGYTWNTYRELPLVDVGLKTDKETEIIGNTYDPGDSGDDATKIVIARFAEPDGDIDNPGADGCVLAQLGSYEALGPEVHLTYDLWGVQWVLGLTHIGDDYAAAVVEGITMAAS